MPADARARFVLFLDSGVINLSITFATMIAHSRSTEYRRNIVPIAPDIAISRISAMPRSIARYFDAR
jgi:hypothetical protein